MPLPRPKRSYHVGLVLAGRGPESMLARALVDIAGEADLRDELDQALNERLESAVPVVERD
jgi:hypothetical protein